MTSVSHNCHFHYYCLICFVLDTYNRCRWIPNSEEPLIYVKYDNNRLNILDAQKGTLTLKKSVLLEKEDHRNSFEFTF